jgi:hypothetical protein
MRSYLVHNMGRIKSQKTIRLIRGLTESTGQSNDVSNPAPCCKTYNTVSAMWTCEQLRYVLHVCLATCRIISAAASKPHANPTIWIFNWIIQQLYLKQVPDGFMDSETVCTSSFCNQTLASMSSYGLWGLQWRLLHTWVVDSRIEEVSTGKETEGNGQRQFTVILHYSDHRNILSWRTPLGLHASKVRLRARGNDLRVPCTRAGYGRISVWSR